MTVSVMAEAAICRYPLEYERVYRDEEEAYRRDSSRLDVVLGTFASQGFGETNKTHFSSAVVGLTKVAFTYLSVLSRHLTLVVGHTIKTSSTRGVNHTSKLLLAEERPSSLRAGKSTLQVNLSNLVPFFIRHIFESEHQRSMMSVFHINTGHTGKDSPLVP